MKIIEMNSWNLEAVEALEQENFAHPWSYQSLEDGLGSPGAHYFVCKEDSGDIVGYIGSYLVCDEAYITNVAVTKASRRKGYATALIERACECAKNSGASFLSLEVRLSNVGAIDLYKKCGFESDGVRPNFYRDPSEDALIMTKRFERGNLL